MQLRVSHLLLTIACLLLPITVQASSGVRTIQWQGDKVPNLRIRDQMPVTIKFPEDEVIDNVVSGNEALFSVLQVSPNTVIIGVQALGIDSTLTAMGASNRAYVFKLTAENTDSETVTDILVHITAPDPETMPIDITLEREKEWLLPDYVRGYITNIDALLFDGLGIYARNVEDDKDIAPLRTWEDTHFTYIDFGREAHTRPRPIVSLLVDGVESPVNTRTIGDNNQVVVAEAKGEFTLRHGQSLICLKKEASEFAEIGGKHDATIK